MKTTSTGSRSLARYASHVAITFLVASVIAGVQPAFASSDDASVVKISIDSPFADPDVSESWDGGESSPGEPDLAPAPEEPEEEPVDPEPAPMSGSFAPSNPGGAWMERPESQFAQPFVNPTIPAPMSAPGGSFGRVR